MCECEHYVPVVKRKIGDCFHPGYIDISNLQFQAVKIMEKISFSSHHMKGEKQEENSRMNSIWKLHRAVHLVSFRVCIPPSTSLKSRFVLAIGYTSKAFWSLMKGYEETITLTLLSTHWKSGKARWSWLKIENFHYQVSNILRSSFSHLLLHLSAKFSQTFSIFSLAQKSTPVPKEEWLGKISNVQDPWKYRNTVMRS